MDKFPESGKTKRGGDLCHRPFFFLTIIRLFSAGNPHAVERQLSSVDSCPHNPPQQQRCRNH
jgi:hypothetical protein